MPVNIIGPVTFERPVEIHRVVSQISQGEGERGRRSVFVVIPVDLTVAVVQNY